MVIRVSHISVIYKPNVSNIKDFVVWSCEELIEVLTGLQKIREPNESRKVSLSSLDEPSSKLNLLILLLISCLYKEKDINDQFSCKVS
jgi:hypothetical protein